ncbi:MAG TPA: M1 family metallopeptidase [Chitinophagaceae bacterium]|nr:M1 family metallopeptidase [Chitinophagaceae bacterium]
MPLTVAVMQLRGRLIERATFYKECMMQKLFFLAVSLCTATFTFAQQQPDTTIDVQHYSFSLNLNDSNNIIQGDAAVTVKFLQEQNELQLDLRGRTPDDSGMLVTAVKEAGQPLAFRQDAHHLFITVAAKAGETRSVTISYNGIPTDGLVISTNRYHHRTFFGDNWPNRAHNWLPCKDHLSDKATVEFIVTAPEHYQVVSNGVQTELTNLPGHRRLTHWVSDAQLPTKVMVIGMADFAVNYVGNVDNIPVYSWVYPEDRDSGFATYAMAKNILPFYISHVGPYAYKKLANVQSKTIFGGMENASAIFYYEKSVSDPGSEALLAHEIAHQWFGDNATEKNWQHLWLSEGFATYMTNLYHEEKYGRDSFNRRMETDRKIVIAFSKKHNTPVVDTSYGNNIMQLLNANSYQKGGWVLHMLRRRLGDTVFWRCIRAYYAQYAGKNASTANLEKVFETVSGQNLTAFFQQWLYASGQPTLAITWRYDNVKKQVAVTVQQQQTFLFDIPLEVAVTGGNGMLAQKALSIKNRQTTVTIPCKQVPAQLIPDPNVNQLFEATVKQE